MTRDDFLAIIDRIEEEGIDSDVNFKNPVLQGLQILISRSKDQKENISSDHDQIFAGSDLDDLLENGLTEVEIFDLIRLGWFFDEECDCFSHFV